jgi:hypothetical protein
MMWLKMPTFGALLTSYLDRSGAPLRKDFAEKIGVAKSLITDMCADRRTPPPEKVEAMAKALGLHGDAASAFRQAAALAHVPQELRRLLWLESYAEDRAAAERRAVFMAFAALRHFAPAVAEGMITNWQNWPENEQSAAELLREALRNQEPRRRP